LTDKFISNFDKQSTKQIALLMAAGILAGLYAVVVTSIDNYRIMLLFVAAPTAFAALALKGASRIYLIVLVISLSFGARFRFGGAEFRQGGAEAALAPLDFPMFGLLLLWLIQFVTRKQKLAFRITGVGLAFVLFVTAHIISVVAAYDSNLALLELIRLIKMGLLILIIRHCIRTENDLSLALSVLLGMLIVQGTLAITQSFFDTSFGLGFLGETDSYFTEQQGTFVVGRAGGTLGHPNVLGYFFEMTLPIALAVFFWCKRGKLKVISFCAVGLGLFGSFLTYSRATWIAVLIGLFVVILATMLLQRQHWGRNLIYMALVLLGVTAVGFIFKDSIIQRLEVFGSASWNFRLQTFELAWNMIQARPLFGIGANNYLAAIPMYNYAGITSLAEQAIVHNILLLFTAETGLFGLITFIILLATITHRTYRTVKAGPTMAVATAIGILAGIIAIMAHSMLDWLFRFDPVYTLFWFNVGLLLALANISIQATRDRYEHHSPLSDSQPELVAV
jgi:putative inorganic carbon (hco3(-)) transporter